MEPQLEGCGKVWSNPERIKRLKLQWSRNLRVAERLGIAPNIALNRRASMEPQLEGCGKSGKLTVQEMNDLGFNGAAT